MPIRYQIYRNIITC